MVRDRHRQGWLCGQQCSLCKTEFEPCIPWWEERTNSQTCPLTSMCELWHTCARMNTHITTDTRHTW